MPISKYFFRLTWVVLFISFSIAMQGESRTYYTLTDEQGLKGLDVMQMLQLEDGRMVMVTWDYVNIYDGMSFRSVRRDEAYESVIQGYKGHTRLYVDGEQRLWVKNMGKVSCLNLRTLSFIPGCDSLFRYPSATDFFVDSDKDLWLVDSRRLVNNRNEVTLLLPDEAGDVQDLDVYEKRLYVFTHWGEVIVFDVETGERIAICAAYGEPERILFDKTSLIVRNVDGRFYQIRMGDRRSIFLSFDPLTLSWSRLMESDTQLHTLVVTAAQVAYISTSNGYIVYNLRNHETVQFDSLRLPDGTMLATGLNTVCQDREGGIWLGSYHKGVLYSSPLSGIFDTHERDIRLTPLLLSVYLHGKAMDVLRGEMAVDAPYTEHLEFGYDDNDLTFLFSSQKYVRPRNVYWRYRLSGHGDEWQTVTADSHPDLVDDRGRLRLSFVDLLPGEYVLEVMVSANADRWNGSIRRIGWVIRHPWWATLPAYVAYVLFALSLLALSVWLYVRKMRLRAEQKSREDMLLMRIQDLIEKCNQYESAVNVVLTDKDEPEEQTVMSEAEMDFLNRATALVERNLSNSSYSVEQLSRDICMERSGLYKKLTAVLDKSPVAFIRMIRLRKAVELLRLGNMTIAEIAEATGFSSPSYFSKCFQKEYGCKPSEYLQRSSEGNN